MPTIRGPQVRAAMLMRLRGIGPDFAEVLWSEGLFRRFDNRRQLASSAGVDTDALAKRLDQSRAGRVENREPAASKHPWYSSHGSGCCTNRDRSTDAMVPGARSGSAVASAEKRLIVAAARSLVRTLEVRVRRRADRRRRHEDCVIPNRPGTIVLADPSEQDLHPHGLKSRRIRMVSVLLSLARRKRDVGAAAGAATECELELARMFACQAEKAQTWIRDDGWRVSVSAQAA